MSLNLNKREWHIHKSDVEYGPFCFSELIQMLQIKSINEVDFVRQGEKGGWKKIADHPAFTDQALKWVYDQYKDQAHVKLETIFLKRKVPRLPTQIDVLLIQSQSILKAKTTEIGVSGARIVFDNPSIKIDVGSELRFHLKKNDLGIQPFNINCKIVGSKKSTLCIEFLNLNEEAKQQISSVAHSDMKRVG